MNVRRVLGASMASALVVVGCTSSSGGGDASATPQAVATTMQASTTTVVATSVVTATAPEVAPTNPGEAFEPSASASTPPEMLVGTDAFVVQTDALGLLRWTRFEVPDGDTPPFVSLDPMGGYIAHGDGGDSGSWSETVMHSLDGTAWRILEDRAAADASSRIDPSYSAPDTETVPGAAQSTVVHAGDFGFFALGDLDSGGSFMAWVSSNGSDWELIDLPPDTGFDGGFGAVGDLIFRSSDRHDPNGSAHPMVLWIGRFESSHP